MFEAIPESAGWKDVTRLNKGWSSDTKYRVTDESGNALLLRISDAAVQEKKKKEYEVIQKIAELGFPMSQPIAFGLCANNQHAYMLLTWLEGRDLEEVLPLMPKEKQYHLGRQAGKILKSIHSLPLDKADMPTATKAQKKLMQLEKYETSAVRIAGDENAIAYVKSHIGQIWQEKPVYLHGDFHPGNLIYREDDSLGVIDFNRWEIGDPYEEFYKLESFARELSIPYCIGQINAYFNDHVPDAFWQTLAVYVAHASLYSIKWAEKFGQQDIDNMAARCKTAFDDYDGFRRYIPKWYPQA